MRGVCWYSGTHIIHFSTKWSRMGIYRFRFGRILKQTMYWRRRHRTINVEHFWTHWIAIEICKKNSLDNVGVWIEMLNYSWYKFGRDCALLFNLMHTLPNANWKSGNLYLIDCRLYEFTYWLQTKTFVQAEICTISIEVGLNKSVVSGCSHIESLHFYSQQIVANEQKKAEAICTWLENNEAICMWL